MARLSWVLLAVAVFSVVNLAGAVFAAAEGEALYASIHAGLLIVGALLAGWLAQRRGASRVLRRGDEAVAAAPADPTARLVHLEQAVDAVAIEVERIGEGQRYLTRALTENDAVPALDRRSP